MEVTPGGSYAWLQRPESERQRTDREFSGLMKESFEGSDRSYGARRVWRELSDQGVTCSMSRNGDYWDNAGMESFFSTLKTERCNRRS